MCKLLIILSMTMTGVAVSSTTDEHDEVCLLSLRANMTSALQLSTSLKAKSLQRVANLESQSTAMKSRQEESAKWSKSNSEFKSKLMEMKSDGSQKEVRKDASPFGPQAPPPGMPQSRAPTVDDSGVRITTDAKEITTFILDQMDSKDTCFSRLMESKRTIDGIGSKVLQISDEIEAEQSIIEGNDAIITNALAELRRSEEILEADQAECQRQYEEAWAAIQGKRDEITELEQIANPGVRSAIAHEMNVEDYVKSHITKMEDKFRNVSYDALENQGLIEINKENCQRVVNFLNARTATKKGDDDETTDQLVARIKYSSVDCDAGRELLQTAFSEAYVEIKKLIQEEEAEATAALEQCNTRAQNDHDERASVQQDKIKQCTADITAARDTISELQPLLNNGKDETQRMTQHIETLKRMCTVDEDVTEHLKAVRRLIMSLESCPGRNDFKLMIPGGRGAQKELQR